MNLDLWPSLMSSLSCGAMPEADLRDLLLTHGPAARDDLRRVLIRDHADRDAIASRPSWEWAG